MSLPPSSSSDSPSAGAPMPPGPAYTGGDQVADRRAKLQRLRQEFGIDPYGRRIDGLISLAEARARYDAAADQAFKANHADDRRPVVQVAGRVMLHRNIGKLIFLTIRDWSGDIQLGISKAAVSDRTFKLARLVDLGDIVAARGPLGTTNTGEVTVWVSDAHPLPLPAPASATPSAFTIVTKSLVPPPEKFHGLQDPELRYRLRYVDMFTNPQTIRTLQRRSQIISAIRRFMDERGFLEVETPMLQPQAGGAAARPFVTHHNALDIDLFLRIAPELYLKRLLVGGLPRVYEINRNFRNEGIDRLHNPEFTMMELYQAFGDLASMMDLAEQLIYHLAVHVAGGTLLPFGDWQIDYRLPFRRATYHELFAQHAGFDPADHDRLLQTARQLGIDPADKDHDLLLNEVWEELVEEHLIQPTFVTDYPASLCPLTRPDPDRPHIAQRFELFIARMEIANAYTELNDPDLQEANFRRQLAGLREEEKTFRSLDEDFLYALRVGMPPAGGMGIGIDRLVMLLTNSLSIRDVIFFPLLRPEKR